MTRENSSGPGAGHTETAQESLLADTKNTTSTDPGEASPHNFRGIYVDGEGAGWRYTDVAEVARPELLAFVPTAHTVTMTDAFGLQTAYLSGPATLAVLSAHDNGEDAVAMLADSVATKCGVGAARRTLAGAREVLDEMQARELGQLARLTGVRVVRLLGAGARRGVMVARILDRYDDAADVLDGAARALEVTR